MADDDLLTGLGESPTPRRRRRGNPLSKVFDIARADNIPDEIAEDFTNLIKFESGASHYDRRGRVKLSPPDPRTGEQAVGAVQIKPSTAREVGVLNPFDEDENIKAGLRYFAKGGADPVARRIRYFGGPRAQQRYERTGRIPQGGDVLGTSFQAYVKNTGGQRPQRPAPEDDLATGLATTQDDDLLTGLGEPVAAPQPKRPRPKRSPFAGVRAGVRGETPQTIEAADGFVETAPGQPGTPRDLGPSMQARRPGIIERAREAIIPYVPGLTSIDTPAGIKTDPVRGLVRGITLGAAGGKREITPEELLINPRAETERDVAEFAGETAGGLIPYVGAGKVIGKIPALARAGRTAAAARTGATFGTVETARELIHAGKTGEPVRPEEIAVSTAIGAAMGAIPGADAGLKQRIFAAVAPQVVADYARGTPLEYAAQAAITNVLFEAAAGRKLGLSRKRIRELREQIGASQTVPPETQRRLRRAEQVETQPETLVDTRAVREVIDQPRGGTPVETAQPEIPVAPAPAVPTFVEEARRRIAERQAQAPVPPETAGIPTVEPVEVRQQEGARLPSAPSPAEITPEQRAREYEQADRDVAAMPIERRLNPRDAADVWTPERRAQAKLDLMKALSEGAGPIEPEIAPDSTRYYEMEKLPLTERGKNFLEFRRSIDRLQEDQRNDLYKGLYEHLRSGFEKNYMRGGAEILPIKDKGIEWFAREMRSAYNKGEIKKWEDIQKAANPVSGSFRGASIVGRDAVRREVIPSISERQQEKGGTNEPQPPLSGLEAIERIKQLSVPSEGEGAVPARSAPKPKLVLPRKRGESDAAYAKRRMIAQAETAEGKTIQRRSPRGRAAFDPSTQSLSEAHRAYGGVREDKTGGNRGEIRRISQKETGTSGLINKDSPYNAEDMALAMAEHGYRGDWVEVHMGPHGPEYRVNGDKYLEAVEADLSGSRKTYAGGAEESIDYDAEIAKHYADQQKAYEAEEARTEFLAGGRGAELLDKIAEGKGNDAERTEFVKLARERGISEAEAEDIIAGAREEIADLEASSVQRPAVAEPEPAKSTRPAQQLGFVEEGLRQQEAPRPKAPNQREALIAAEKERQRTADPERAAAIEQLASIRERGMTVDEFARQGSLLGETPTPERIALLRELEKGTKKSAAPEQPSFVQAAIERQAKRAEEKAKGIEYRRAGADPYELVDNIIVRGYELYSQKVKPTFEEWSRKLREEFGPEAEKHIQKVWAQLGGEKVPTTTVAKREKATEQREARGEEAIPRPKVKPDEELLESAKAANQADKSEPMRIVDQVLNGKKASMSDKETVQVDLHVQELKNKYDEVNREIGSATDTAKIRELADRSDAIEREMRAAEEAWAASGTETARALRSRRIEIDQDYRLLTMVSKAKKAKGSDLTPEEHAKIKEQSEKIAELEAKVVEADNRAAAAEAERAAGRMKEDFARENRRSGRRQRKQSLDQEAAELRQLIAQAWKKQKGGGADIHSAMGLAKLDPEGVVTKLVVQLAKNRIKANVGLKAEALVDEVHALLSDVADLSRRDVAEMISGYGKTFEMSQEAVDVRLRELKSIIASNLGKADIIEKGIRPLRRGLQRDKPSQEVREAMRDLRDTLREHGMRVERSKGSPEEQQKSALDAAKTQTRNRIEDLTKWIADGKRTVANKTEIIPDEELTTLRAERDRLQKVFEAIDDPAADQRKIENALRSVNKSIVDLEAKIRSGQIAPVPRGTPLSSPELNAARAEQKALRGILTDMRTAAKAKAPPAEVEARRLLAANKAMTSRLERQIADFERRIAQGDFSPAKKKPPIPITRERMQLQNQLDRIKHEYNKANYKAIRGRFGQITDELAKAANVPKTLKSMGDISAVFRQGGYYSITHPIEGFAKPSVDMLRAFTETGYRNVEQLIQNHPKFEQAKRDGVEFTGIDKTDPHLSRKEEGYFGGETIDVIGSGKYNPLRALKAVKGFSERTFVSFLDSQRMHIYDTITKGLEAQGLTPQNAPASYKGAAKLINIGTGRGNLGKRGNQAAPFLNILMFSPRLVTSRVQLLNNMFNPVAMARKPPGIRAQNIKDNVKFLAATAAVMGLATAAGGTVNRDPDDADFLKIRFGKTTYDTLTGLQQPMRYIINMARAATGGETHPGQDMPELTTRFARSKASPLAGLVVDAVTGEDFRGRKFSAKRAAVETVTPLPVTDFKEAMEKEGLLKGFVKTTPALTGIGVQTYDERPEKPTTHAEKLARKFYVGGMKDKSRTDEEIEVDKKKGELRARARRGEDVSAELDKLPLTEKQKDRIMDAKGVTMLQQDFKQLQLPDALKVYGVMTRGEQQSVRDILATKALTVGNLTPNQQIEMNAKLAAIGLLPPANVRPKRPQRPSRNTRSNRQGYQWAQ